MSSLMRVGVFVGFLVIYVVWLIVTLKLTNKLQGDLLRGKTFFVTELMILINWSGFFAFNWILSGFFDISLFGLFLIASHLGAMISGVLWAIVGTPRTEWGARIMFAGAEIAVSETAIFRSFQIQLNIPQN